MYEGLRKFISGYAEFPAGELDEIVRRFKSKKVKSGSFLLSPGEVCKHLVFVDSGCLRLYYLKDQMEVSVWFSFAQSSAIEVHSFISETPSNYFIQAIEDSEIFFLSKKELDKLCLQKPAMQVMMKHLWEDVILNLIGRFTALETDSARKRYLDLLSKPPYVQSIPLKYLASFIGVTPSSLSRIRRQIKSR